ncbi:dynamin family protein [Curvibacter gracilis]|uniref:dynamin family protein n=1 Tax=Curvibacter gracilis TaxID=230310 RepID=UPI0004880F83|nr:GTPase domain-containing protein [Curvibacter gracilis]
MAPDTLEQQLLPALTQLGRFWSLNRKKWVNDARQQISAADALTARILKHQAVLKGDLEHQKVTLKQLQDTHSQQAERLRECTDANTTLTVAHNALLLDASALRDALSESQQTLTGLELALAELKGQRQALTQENEQQGSALAQAQASHQSLQMAYSALEQRATQSQRDLLVASEECRTLQATLESLREVHQQVQRDLAQHQKWLQQEQAANQVLAHEKAVLQKKEALVREILSAPPRVHPPHRHDPEWDKDQFEEPTGGPSFSDWLKVFFVPALGELHLPAEPLAFVLDRVQELEATVAMLESTPLLRDKFVVAVAGGFSSGKSSFISSLIEGQTIELPNGMEPVTSIPTYVMSGGTDAIRGHTFRGGEISMSVDIYKGLSHDFAQSLGFNLRDILPYVTIETTLRHVEHLAFVDLPGYDAADSEGIHTAGDELTATDFMQSADAIVWVVGLDSNGTLPETDLAHLDKLSQRDLPIHVVLNKADLREPSQVTEVLDQIRDLLEAERIQFVGLSAYSSVLGEELQFLQKSLLESFGLWDQPGQPMTRVLRQFGELMDQVEGASSQRTATLDAVKSLRLDFMELLSHLPNGVLEESDLDSQRREYIEHVYSADEIDDLIGAQAENGTRLPSLRRNVNKRMMQLQKGLLANVDPGAAKDLLLRMRQEGMNYLERALA